jgi:hypothetical protein
MKAKAGKQEASKRRAAATKGNRASYEAAFFHG